MADVILVDQKDRETGREEKQAAHVRGLLHRAFSVFLTDGTKMLIQQRAPEKYHCGGPVVQCLLLPSAAGREDCGGGAPEAAGRAGNRRSQSDGAVFLLLPG